MLIRKAILFGFCLLLVSCGGPMLDTADLGSMDPVNSPGGDSGNTPQNPPYETPPQPTPTPGPTPAPAPDPFPAGWTPAWNADNKHPERKSWTEHTFTQTSHLVGTALSGNLVDAREFCPAFAKLGLSDRRAFLTVLLSAMAKYESNFNPAAKYEENFDDNNGNPVISRGLLQLSVESSNSYGCKVTASALHDPNTNLSCGLRIISRWMVRDNRVGSTVNGSHLGGARYWSVLRESSKSRPKIVAYMRSQPKCK